MVLKRSDPPIESLQALAETLPSLRKPSGGAILQSMKSMSNAKEAQQSLHPRPVYVVGLDRLLHADRPEPRLQGWQYMVDSDAGQPAAAEVASVETAGGATHRFAMLTESPTVGRTFALGRELELLEAEEPSSHELRVLRVPALNVIALWLKDEAGDKDSFIAVQGPRSLPKQERYSAAAWWSMLQTLAATAAKAEGAPSPLVDGLERE